MSKRRQPPCQKPSCQIIFTATNPNNLYSSKSPVSLSLALRRWTTPRRPWPPLSPPRTARLRTPPVSRLGRNPPLPLPGISPRRPQPPLSPPRTARFRRPPVPRLERSPPSPSLGISPRKPGSRCPHQGRQGSGEPQSQSWREARRPCRRG